MNDLKVHLKLKKRALCGARSTKRPLRFASDEQQVTCGRCRKAVEK